MPYRILSSVDLPVPLAPTMPTRSLGVTSQSRFSKRVLGPNRLAAPVSWIMECSGKRQVQIALKILFYSRADPPVRGRPPGRPVDTEHRRARRVQEPPRHPLRGCALYNFWMQ